ncbi:MAG TPA: DUF6152 family protein [Gammaproteobacteria bacterium]
MNVLIKSGLIFAVCASRAAFAHHYFAPEYERETMVTIEAVVKGVYFRNPHVRLEVEVTTEDGGKEIWAANSVSPNSVSARGWQAETIAIGDSIRLYGNLGSNESKRLWIQTITLADGTEIYPVGRLPDVGDDR